MTIEEQAKLNYQGYLKAYDDLKMLLKKSSNEDIEEYIVIMKEQLYVEDEDRLRRKLYEIRDEV